MGSCFVAPGPPSPHARRRPPPGEPPPLFPSPLFKSQDLRGSVSKPVLRLPEGACATQSAFQPCSLSALLAQPNTLSCQHVNMSSTPRRPIEGRTGGLRDVSVRRRIDLLTCFLVSIFSRWHVNRSSALASPAGCYERGGGGRGGACSPRTWLGSTMWASMKRSRARSVWDQTVGSELASNRSLSAPRSLSPARW